MARPAPGEQAGWAGLKHQSPLQSPAAFIRANTWLAAPPLLPEIRLYLARDAFGLWERIEHDTGQDQLPPPFWAFPWAGGQALARYLLDHPGRVRGQAVLDLASGSGLVAIAAAVAGAASVTPSETDSLAVAAITLNAGVNRVRLEPTAGDLLGGLLADAAGPADVLRGRRTRRGAGRGRTWCWPGTRSTTGPWPASMLPYLERASQAGALVLVGDPGRAYLPRERFTQVATYEVPVERVIEDTDVKHTTVWRLRYIGSAAAPALDRDPQPSPVEHHLLHRPASAPSVQRVSLITTLRRGRVGAGGAGASAAAGDGGRDLGQVLVVQDQFRGGQPAIHLRAGCARRRSRR